MVAESSNHRNDRGVAAHWVSNAGNGDVAGVDARTDSRLLGR